MPAIDPYRKATDRQLKLIRYLEEQFDPPTRLSPEILNSMTKQEAGQFIGKLNKFHDNQLKERQMVLL